MPSNQLPDYFQYWGKAKKYEKDTRYHPLVYHCLDVAAVATKLLERNPKLLEHLCEVLSIPKEQLKPWLIWVISLHDVGKFSLDFQGIVPTLQAKLRPGIRATPNQQHHTSLGFRFWQDVLFKQIIEKSNVKQGKGFFDFMDRLMAATTGHHGKPPQSDTGPIGEHFDARDQEAAKQFSKSLLDLFKVDFSLVARGRPSKEEKEAEKYATWPIAGLCVLADWLGSNTDYFSYCEPNNPDLKKYWTEVALPGARRAAEKSGTSPVATNKLLEFGELFSASGIIKPSPLQKACVKRNVVAGSNLFILEDLTGSGKTEAALMLAHKIMVQGGADGLYIALPTMATADFMFSRAKDVYRQLFQEDHKPSLSLLHGSRHLNSEFKEAIEDSPPDTPHGVGDDNETASIHCSRWIADSNKRGLLADIGVGTIDQALLAVLPVKHQALRLYGLFRKVLLVDELHAIDCYQLELLERLIEVHTANGGSTILLSATLPLATRQQFVDACRKATQHPVQECESDHFPLMTHVGMDFIDERETTAARTHSIETRFVHSEDAVKDVISSALTADKAVCWIRNTVDDAINAWQSVQQKDGVSSGKCTLLHSRFALHDRFEIEGKLRGWFGKDSTSQDRAGRLLIATQVVEQSVDLDFDVMITDLASIDLVIQRAGRFRRHPRDAQGNPAQQEQRSPQPLIILAPEFTESPTPKWLNDVLPTTPYIYPLHYLWKTAKLLTERNGWCLPDDARTLVEGVYNKEITATPDGLEASELEAQGEKYSDMSVAQMMSLDLQKGYFSDNMKWHNEGSARTRLNDDSMTVFLARAKDGLKPLFTDNKNAWDLSSVKVRIGKMSKYEAAPEEYEMVKSLIKRSKRFSDYDKDAVWVVSTESKKGVYQVGISHEYSRLSGLRLKTSSDMGNVK